MTREKKIWIDYAAVREALDFEDVLDHYGFARSGSGEQRKIHCPFHEDRTPSCSINTGKGIFKCFGCDAKGNVLEFVALMERGDPGNLDDLHKAAEIAIDIMERRPEDFGKPQGSRKRSATPAKSERRHKPAPKKPAAKPRSAKKEDNDSAEDAPNPVLEISLDLDPEHPFLTDRGIARATAERYEMGYCSSGIMKGRIAIPIHNADGELVAYVGRYAGEDVLDGEDRYRFPKRFKKSLELFNIHRATALDKRFVVLVEGFWSAMRLHDLGIPAAAIMGTTLSAAQAERVAKSGFKYAVLLLDPDDAGRKAAPDNAGRLAEHVYVHTVWVPDGEKPDSVSKSFLERFL